MNAKTTRKIARPPVKTAKAGKPGPAKRAPSKAARKPNLPAAPLATSEESKQAQLIALLRSPAGGTIEQLTRLTGWQPHSVRGVISGALRKRLKLNVTCEKSVYRIVEAQA